MKFRWKIVYLWLLLIQYLDVYDSFLFGNRIVHAKSKSLNLYHLFAKPNKIEQPRSEFSRIINVQKIPLRGAECRLLANEKERIALGKRLQCIDGVQKLSANLTLTWENEQSIRINGKFEVQIPLCIQKNNESLDITDLDMELDSDLNTYLSRNNTETEIDVDTEDIEANNDEIMDISQEDTFIESISESFDTLLLYDPTDISGNRYIDDPQYDDQIPADGNLDLGAIVIDYITLHIFI